MKKTLLTILILFTLTLTACGATNAQAANPAGNASGTGSYNNNFVAAPLPLASELLIGTFKLEGTTNAITAEEAAKLLPLWQVYKDLSTSTSAAQTEIDALATQIQETMTPAQVQAITDLKLTRKDMSQTMQDLGIASTRPNASGTPRPGGGQGGNFLGGGNGAPGAGAPGGGQGFNNGQNLSPQQIATFQAARSQNEGGNGQFNRIPPALYDALIKLLQSKK